MTRAPGHHYITHRSLIAASDVRTDADGDAARVRRLQRQHLDVGTAVAPLLPEHGPG
jgi:hypothetical protein